MWQLISNIIMASMIWTIVRMFAGLFYPDSPMWVIRTTQIPALPFILFALLIYIFNFGILFQLKHLRAFAVWGDKEYPTPEDMMWGKVKKNE